MKTNKYFLIKAKYIKIDEVSGKEKKVTEPYLVDAMSVTEAEARAVKELAQMVSGEFTVSNANVSNIIEVLRSDKGGYYYKCKVSFIDIDAVSGRESKTNNYMLIQAENVKQAYENLENNLNTMIVPFEIPNISKSNIVDIFEYAE